jgi:uncharacterized protein (TIGR00645 family)
MDVHYRALAGLWTIETQLRMLAGSMSAPNGRQSKATLASFIFLSRWLQAPLYLGLIVAQAVYVYRFLLELGHLIGFALFHHAPPASTPQAVQDTETIVMLSVLGLIDVVMIANLLIMVIVGGYETFVSRLRLEGHPDQPEWLSHVNAGILKVKLATALIGISSIHLLKTFINAANLEPEMMQWQVIIHFTFVASAISLAWIDRLTFRAAEKVHSLRSELASSHAPARVRAQTSHDGE